MDDMNPQKEHMSVRNRRSADGRGGEQRARAKHGQAEIVWQVQTCVSSWLQSVNLPKKETMTGDGIWTVGIPCR